MHMPVILINSSITCFVALLERLDLEIYTNSEAESQSRRMQGPLWED